MNKAATKQMYEKAGIPVPPFVIYDRNDTVDADACAKQLGLPLVVKPVVGGSSVGMSIIKSVSDLQGAVEKAFEFDSTVMVEAYVDGIELTGGVIGNRELEAFPVIEIVPDKTHDFFDYEAKYTAGITQEICPARIDEELTLQAQTYAKNAHQALFCRGYSRTDMILKDREIYVLETNTIPGMTATSLLPQAAAASGLNFTTLLDRLIELGLEEQ